jgi:hypothetical protein
MQGPTISVGLAELKDSRMAIMVAGIKVIQEVFKARNVHMASEASDESRFNFCNSCIAFMPSGVAALPRPNILALKFRFGTANFQDWRSF